jgi:hypothetical protein
MRFVAPGERRMTSEATDAIRRDGVTFGCEPSQAGPGLVSAGAWCWGRSRVVGEVLERERRWTGICVKEMQTIDESRRTFRLRFQNFEYNGRNCEAPKTGTG